MRIDDTAETHALVQLGKDNPAVLCTLDKMNSMSGMQGELFPERAQALHKAYKICHDAYYKREKVREESRCC